MKVKVWGKSKIVWNSAAETWDREEEIEAKLIPENEQESDMFRDDALYMLLEEKVGQTITLMESDGDKKEVSRIVIDGRQGMEVSVFRYNLSVDEYAEDDLRKAMNDLLTDIEAAIKEYREKKFTFEVEMEKTLNI